MNTEAFRIAKDSYQRGDWAGAASALANAKSSGEAFGEADHLRGNALMKLGRYAEAAAAYAEALSDAAYGHVGALNCNRGRALVAAGQDDAALACFQAAVSDPSYPTPYKAYLALGKLFEKRGFVVEAASAWRSAAIDEQNPDPAQSLVKLGACFMQLTRPNDAIDAYRTALDFSTSASTGAINAELGQAYMACNKISEAADAFNHSAADPNYTLTPEQQVAFSAAQRALSAAAGSGPSETDQMLANAGYGNQGLVGADQSGSQAVVNQGYSQGAAYDPLDPMGRSGEFIPSPEDTGFFSVTEEDLMKADRDDRKMRRKHNHRGLKVVLFILLLLAILGGVGGFAYYKGYGWPTQEAVVSDMFSAGASGSDIAPYLSSSITDDARKDIESIMPRGATCSVSGVDRSMAQSTVLVNASLASSGNQSYSVSLARDGLGWKVTGVKLTFASQGSSSDAASGSLATTVSDGEVAPDDSSVSTGAAASQGASTESSAETTEVSAQ